MNIGINVAMPAQIWKKPVDVGNRLDRLFQLL